MVTVLKQVLKHELNAISEYDAGFRGPNGGIGKYDLYIPQTNTLVECQSRRHDESEVAIIDKLKRQYAIDKGYQIITMDSREYTYIQAIQKFFPGISKIPEYVNLEERNRRIFDFEKAQELINKGKKYREVAEELGVTTSTISGYVYTGKLSTCAEVVLKLDKDMRIVSRYELTDILKDGTFNYNTKARMIEACRSNSHKYNRYYEKDYNKIINENSKEDTQNE